MATEITAQELPPCDTRPGLAGMLDTMQNNLVGLERAIAGYEATAEIVNQSINGVKQGERRRGIPVIRFTTSLEGSPIDVEADLRKLPPQELAPMLTPLCRLYGSDMLAAVQRILTAANEADQTIRKALGIEQPAAQQELPTLQT